MTDRIEIMTASALEMEDVISKEGRLTGKPVFYKSGVGADAMIVRVFDEDNKIINTTLLRVSPSGELRLFDRTKRLNEKVEKAKEE